MKKLLLIFLVSFLVSGIVGCSNHDNSSNGSSEKISIRGEIKQVVVGHDDKVESIYVEGNKESDTDYEKANIKITEGTVFEQHESMGHSSEYMIGKGIKVEVVFTGEVQESNPVQATAKSIKVID